MVKLLRKTRRDVYLYQSRTFYSHEELANIIARAKLACVKGFGFVKYTKVDELHAAPGIGVTGIYTRRLSRGYHLKPETFVFAGSVQRAARSWLIHAIKHKQGGNIIHTRAMLRIQQGLPKKLLDALSKQVDAL